MRLEHSDPAHAANDLLTGRIIACCFEVHNALGAGFIEKVYENALMFELRARGINVEQQVPVSVTYKGAIVGQYCADLLVEGRVVCELKAGQALSVQHEVQLVNYLSATGIDVGLLIHFGRSVSVKRKHRCPDQSNVLSADVSPVNHVNPVNPV